MKLQKYVGFEMKNIFKPIFENLSMSEAGYTNTINSFQVQYIFLSNSFSVSCQFMLSLNNINR